MKSPDLYLAQILECLAKIHAYDRVDVEEVWNFVEKGVPGLAAKIRAIRDELARQQRIPPPTG